MAIRGCCDSLQYITVSIQGDVLSDDLQTDRTKISPLIVLTLRAFWKVHSKPFEYVQYKQSSPYEVVVRGGFKYLDFVRDLTQLNRLSVPSCIMTRERFD